MRRLVRRLLEALKLRREKRRARRRFASLIGKHISETTKIKRLEDK